MPHLSQMLRPSAVVAAAAGASDHDNGGDAGDEAGDSDPMLTAVPHIPTTISGTVHCRHSYRDAGVVHDAIEACIDSDGERAARGAAGKDNRIQVHDASSGDLLASLRCSLCEGAASWGQAVAFSTDGRMLALACSFGEEQHALRIVSFSTDAGGAVTVAQDVQIPQHGPGLIQDICWSLDGTLVAVQVLHEGAAEHRLDVYCFAK